MSAANLRVVVLSDATPGRNGVGTYYDDLAEHLMGRLGEVRMVSPPRNDRTSGGGLSLAMPGDPTQTLFVPRISGIWREVRALAPHVIISPTPGLYGLLGMTLAARTGAAYCVAYHTEFPKLAELYWGDRPGLGRFARWVAGGIDALMFRRADAVLVYNAELRESVRARGVDEVELMGTPAPPPFLSRPLRPLSGTVETVAYVGRLAPEKRVGQVLEAARRLPDIRFRFAGDGPVREEVEACADRRDNVDVLGWVDRPTVLDVLDHTDLLVLPSRHETFGTAAFEAMARRRPALVSPTCGIVEWPDLVEGLFVMDPGERVVDAVRRIRALGAGARRRVAERGHRAARALSADTVDRWVDVLTGVVDRGKPSG